MRKLEVVAIVMLVCTVGLADSPTPPYTHIAASTNGKFYFKMIPDPNPQNLVLSQPRGVGIMYEVSSNGPDKELWRVSGWYAHAFYVSHDGKYLVRLGNWPVGDKPSHEDLAIAFYMEGKLIKSYSTKDIIRNPQSVIRSVSHYEYLERVIGFTPSSPYEFVIRTVERLDYAFDIRNGKIISKTSFNN